LKSRVADDDRIYGDDVEQSHNGDMRYCVWLESSPPFRDKRDRQMQEADNARCDEKTPNGDDVYPEDTVAGHV
jgi:hypothetical protein